jgi:hypothetical protein
VYDLSKHIMLIELEVEAPKKDVTNKCAFFLDENQLLDVSEMWKLMSHIYVC